MSMAGGYGDADRPSVISCHGLLGAKLRGFHGTTAPASGAWPTANTAYLVPFVVAYSTTIQEMFFVSGTTPGTANFDLGIYREDFTLIASLGATAAVNTTDVIQPVGGGAFASAVKLTRGRYYMAMSAAATTITTRCHVSSNDFMSALGLQQMASAHPLPATVTPASMAGTAFLPLFGVLLVDNVL